MVFTAVFTAVETTSREPSCFWFPTVAHWHSEKDVLMVSMDLNRMKLLELSINMHQLFGGFETFCTTGNQQLSGRVFCGQW
jgi:hypothetical protein